MQRVKGVLEEMGTWAGAVLGCFVLDADIWVFPSTVQVGTDPENKTAACEIQTFLQQVMG